MSRKFDRRLKRLETKAGFNAGPPCTCAEISALTIVKDMLGVSSSGDNGNTLVDIMPIIPCEARVHYYDPEYKSGVRPDPVTRVNRNEALAKLFDDDVPEIPDNVATEALDYQEAKWKRLEGDGDDGIPVELLTPKPKLVDPLEIAIAKRINKLRPPGAKEIDDPERWLELPTDV